MGGQPNGENTLGGLNGTTAAAAAAAADALASANETYDSKTAKSIARIATHVTVLQS